MQALIVRDRFDNAAIANDLKQELSSICSNIVEIESLNDLEKAKILLDGNEPCLYYPNVFLRHVNVPLRSILQFHKENMCFSVLVSRNNLVHPNIEPLSFIPSKVFKANRTNNTLFFLPIDSFNVTGINFTYKKPDEKPILFLYTHNKSEYLKLTLNALHFSMLDTFQIKILLNAPTAEVRDVALAFANNKQYVEVLEITPNSIFSAINLALQYFDRPSKFILMEDDFILPSSVRTYFPNWAFQFMDRLNHFDMVCWGWSSENCPTYFNASRQMESCMTDWVIDYKKDYNIGGHCLAINTDFYIRCGKKHNSIEPVNLYHVPFDEHMQANAKKVCVPSLKGYHIGFNQEMDGYRRRTVDPNHSKTYTVKSLTTNVEKKLNIEDLK